MKKIRIKFTGMPHEFDTENNFITDLLRTRYELEISDQPEFLFYGVFDMSFQYYSHCIRIFLTGEPVTPNFNDCDYAIGYVDIHYGDRYFCANALLGTVGQGIDDRFQNRSCVTTDMVKRKFCNFVYSNPDKGEGAILRQQFCRSLMDYRVVDCPGYVLNNLKNGISHRYERNADFSRTVRSEKWTEGKLAFLKNYKFTIAFENTALNGYITEKLYHPFIAYSIPIYWGAPDVERYINPKAFINCNEYENSIQEVMRRIKELDQDEEQYLDMLRQPPLQTNFDFHQKENLACFLFHIVEKGRLYSKNALHFSTASADDFVGRCSKGQIGMRTIMSAAKGWLKYKLYKN